MSNTLQKKFQKTKEDFICEVCGTKITGSGYTNHCPKCLWSKHVDIFPGDRQSQCQGLMAPVSTYKEHGEWRINFHCKVCGFERPNKISPKDNFEKVIQLASSN